VNSFFFSFLTVGEFRAFFGDFEGDDKSSLYVGDFLDDRFDAYELCNTLFVVVYLLGSVGRTGDFELLISASAARYSSWSSASGIISLSRLELLCFGVLDLSEGLCTSRSSIASS
jgi:hypothetical protein